MGNTSDEILLKTDILRTLTDNLPDMLWIKDVEGRYLFANKAICENLLMAVDTQEPIGKTDVFFALRERARHPDNPEWHTFGELCQNSDQIVADAGRPMRFKEWGNVRGKLLYLEVHKAPFYDEQGHLLGVLGSGRDITEQVLMKEKLQAQRQAFEYQSHHDPLTGLPNRLFFTEQLKERLARLEGGRLSVLFIDLDRFKEINDVFGHERGDRILQMIAQRLAAVVRDEDMLARLGGDEFTLMVSSTDQRHELSAIAEKLLEHIRQPVVIDEVVYHLSASIGISQSLESGETAEHLLKHADAAMYQAKEQGKDRFVFHTPAITEQMSQRLQLEQALRVALEEEQFEVYYQPQIELASGRLRGVEALVRWHHPEKGLLSPAVFMEVAETTGLVVQLDLWMYRKAMQQHEMWLNSGLLGASLVLSLNLSPVFLEQRGFVEHMHELIDGCGVDPALLEMEITENQLMKNLRFVGDQLTALKLLGIRLAMDDFGTGYSSFFYLKELEFDTLKVDRTFVQGLEDSSENQAILQGILYMGRALGMEVVAEGVETAAQQAILARHDAVVAQGFLYAKPMPAHECEAWMKQWQARNNLQSTAERQNG